MNWKKGQLRYGNQLKSEGEVIMAWVQVRAGEMEKNEQIG